MSWLLFGFSGVAFFEQRSLAACGPSWRREPITATQFAVGSSERLFIAREALAVADRQALGLSASEAQSVHHDGLKEAERRELKAC
jgi:hypothetical protein